MTNFYAHHAIMAAIFEKMTRDLPGYRRAEEKAVEESITVPTWEGGQGDFSPREAIRRKIRSNPVLFLF